MYFIVLALKLWRVHAVCGAVWRKVVTTRDAYLRFFLSMLIFVCIAVIYQIIGIHNAVSTSETQFVYEKERICERTADIILMSALATVLGIGLCTVSSPEMSIQR